MVAGATIEGVAEPVETETISVYEAVGGAPFFDDLVDRFYTRVAADPVLAELHPRDLGPSRERTGGFLQQYWGGPTTYSEQRGHPRLRLRHARFAIDPVARDHWVAAMLASLAEAAERFGVHPEVKRMMVEYFEYAATAMINQPADQGSKPSESGKA